MSSGEGWQEEEVRFGGSTVRYRVKGEGPPLVFLPRDNGYGPNMDFLDALAGNWRVHAPWLPGFHNGNPDEWTWLHTTRDLALALSAVVRELQLSGGTLVGVGYGGWVAAEMALGRPDPFDRLILVAPAGIRPSKGVIYDQFLAGTQHYAKLAFSNPEMFDQVYGEEPPFEQLEAWETDREMLCRIAWKPYLYDPSLERLLAGVDIPTVVVHGDNDRIIPLECSERYVAALPNARFEQLANCGHAAELEQPEALARIVNAVQAQVAG